MVSEDSPEELPTGWTALHKVLRTGRKVTIYRNLETGKRFFSKDDLFKYINAGRNNADKPPPASKDREIHAESSSSHGNDETIFEPPSTDKKGVRNAESTSLQPETVDGKNEVPEWLPDGWKVEVRIRKSGVHNGKEYKCYIDPLSQGKFYSKLEVLRYLETVKHKKPAGKDVTVNHENSILEKKTGTSMTSENKVVVQKFEDEDLPSGWIKEIKIRQNSNTIRKDPFYTDPVSGYVFRSKKDALRYVQKGEISKHAIKPKKAPQDALEIKDEISTSSAAKRQKLKHASRRRQLFAGKKGSEMGDLEQSTTENSKISSANESPKTRVPVSPADEIVQGKHPLDDKTQADVQAKKQCTPSSSRLIKDEGSKRGGDKKSPLSDAGVSEKGLGKEDFAENGPVSTPAPNLLQDKKIVETVSEKGSLREPQVNSRKSMDKKVRNLPHRSSKRLAGHEPDQVANLEVGERALISAIRKSQKTEIVQDAHLTSDDLVDGPSAKVEIKPEAEFADHTPRKTSKAIKKDPSAKSTEPLEDQVAPEQLHNKLETEKENDNPGPQLSFLFGSDPCLEFAFKTLTGELPLDDSSVNGLTPTANGGTVQCDNLLGSGTRKGSSGKGHTSRNKSKKKKELNLPRRSSKRLGGGEPELVDNTLASEQFVQNSSTKPCDKGSTPPTDFLDKANQQLGPGTIAELANQLFTNSAERSNRRDGSFEDVAAHSKQPQTRETGKAQLEKPDSTPNVHETGKLDLEKPVPDLSFSIADYWSDPCLDFAFKTLTGVIPIEDTLVQGYFQEQIDVSNCKNGNTPLPEFGSSSLFQTDISLQFDTTENSLSNQQGSVTPSLLPTSNVSFSNCSGVHSQQQILEGNKDLQQKVKS